jgi:hypothetical protein
MREPVTTLAGIEVGAENAGIDHGFHVGIGEDD